MCGASEGDRVIDFHSVKSKKKCFCRLSNYPSIHPWHPLLTLMSFQNWMTLFLPCNTKEDVLLNVHSALLHAFESKKTP